MAMSKVRLLTLAYVKGDASAEEVVRSVERARTTSPSTEEAITATSNGDEMPTSQAKNSWADVGRYFGLMTSSQWDELLKARKRILGY